MEFSQVYSTTTQQPTTNPWQHPRTTTTPFVVLFDYFVPFFMILLNNLINLKETFTELIVVLVLFNHSTS